MSVSVGTMMIGRGHPLVLIAGPCVIENRDMALRVAETVRTTAAAHQTPVIFKSSYRKANRTSGAGFTGPGMEEGLRILEEIRASLALPVLTDIHTDAEASAAAQVVDILQIPALLCRQTDLVQAAARTGKIVNLKKGQFLSPLDMKHVVDKASAAGNEKILVTERGTSFGYNNLVSDMRAIPILRQFGFPVVFDATHSVQLPGGGGDKSSGQREFAPVLARSAVAAGADGVFVETHPDPEQALSDGPNMIPLQAMPEVLATLIKVHAAVRPL